MAKPFFVYLVRCSDGMFYVGHTDDLEKRLSEHNSGEGCQFTSSRYPVRLVWHQEFATREEAKEMETRIKGWSRLKKEALIRGEWARLHELSQCRNATHHMMKYSDEN